LCNECKEVYEPKPDELPKDFPVDKLSEYGGRLHRSHGCRACRQLGYSGRVGIYELLETTERVRKLAQERGSTWEIRQAGIEDGMVTLRQDGWIKAIKGRTSVDEVMRVTKGDRS
jgi:general secretion pathway protein E/type IV pilus assembly protein PilB